MKVQQAALAFLYTFFYTLFYTPLHTFIMITLNTLEEGHIWLLIAYTKAKFDNLPAAFLKQLKEAINDG